jgi:hypothetical protein
MSGDLGGDKPFEINSGCVLKLTPALPELQHAVATNVKDPQAAVVCFKHQALAYNDKGLVCWFRGTSASKAICAYLLLE